MARRARLITDLDCYRLGTLVSTPDGRAWGDPGSIAALEMLLDEAVIIDADNAPPDLVTMNSSIELEDAETTAKHRATLIYPQDSELVPDGLSVCGTLGLQIIGARVGDTVKGRLRRRLGLFRITGVIYQPELAGVRHL